MKLILLSLADRADEDHVCYPSISRISSDTGLDRKTIMSGIKSMCDLGLISAKKKHGSGNKYELLGVQNRHQTSTKNGTGTENGTSPKNGTTTSTKNGTRPVPKTGHESINNLPMNLPDYVDHDLFADFWEMRSGMKNIRQTERAMKLLLTELENLRQQGNDPNEVIGKSIRNSWKDFYPLDRKQQTQPRRRFPS